MKSLLLTPDLSCTGAPIALFQFAKYLIGNGHEVFVLGRDGDLVKDFVNVGATVLPLDISAFSFDYDLYIANTVLSLKLLNDLNIPKEKLFAWVHESYESVSEHQHILNEVGKVKNIICPSRFQIDEYKRKFPNASYHHLRNHVDCQFCGVSSTSNSYAVTGYWEWNKNQKGLIDILNALSLQISINFVGANNSEGIVGHNFWGRVDHTTSVNIISNSYAFISNARRETQNLSAIEAILSKIPVLLSNIPAHQELKSLIPSVVLYDANDPESFYCGYHDLIKQKNDCELLENSRSLALNYFGWDAFATACDNILELLNTKLS